MELGETTDFDVNTGHIVCKSEDKRLNISHFFSIPYIIVLYMLRSEVRVQMF